MSNIHTRQEIIDAYCEAVYRDNTVHADYWWKLLSLPEYSVVPTNTIAEAES